MLGVATGRERVRLVGRDQVDARHRQPSAAGELGDVLVELRRLSLAERLAAYGGGGTNCSLPLQAANITHCRRKFAGCILISDQESWIGTGRHGSTATMTAWQEFVKNQVGLHGREFSGPRLVCIDLQPYATTQTPDRSDILNIGGFSDAVFEVVAAFFTADPTRFVAEIEAVEL